MPFVFTVVNKNYKVKLIKGNEEVVTFLKRLGIIKGSIIRKIQDSGSGFIVLVNETKIAVDKNIASKIFVEEFE